MRLTKDESERRLPSGVTTALTYRWSGITYLFIYLFIYHFPCSVIPSIFLSFFVPSFRIGREAGGLRIEPGIVENFP
jgi:hypothetical protein